MSDDERQAREMRRRELIHLKFSEGLTVVEEAELAEIRAEIAAEQCVKMDKAWGLTLP